MKRITVAMFICIYVLSMSLYAQNYDESKVGNYPLPDIFTFANGKKVKTKAQWAERRKEILDIFEREMYGQMPTAPDDIVLETIEQGNTMGNYATRRQVRMWFNKDKSGPKVDWLIISPNHLEGPVPTIMFLNYEGNHTLLTDKEILINEGWQRNNESFYIFNHKADERSRGMRLDPNQRSIVPVNMLVASGYAVVTACYAEISPDPNEGDKDENGISLQQEFAYSGIFDLWGKRDEKRDDHTAALAAWGWVLMRGMDMIEKDAQLDEKRVLLTGSSRLAKAAMLASAFDERFPVVVLNQTGGGGVPLQKHYFGENVATMTRQFKHWYCTAFAKYANNEANLPFDQHMLLACIAPRALMVQGFDEKWFDTKGEFLAMKAASPVWEFLGAEGLPDVEWPAAYDKSAIGSTLGYFHRDNLHGIAAIDWVWMLEFANKVFEKR